MNWNKQNAIIGSNLSVVQSSKEYGIGKPAQP